MIYYTSWDNLKDLGELYSEWVGHMPSFKGIGNNTFLVVARDGDKFIGAAQLIIVVDRVWGRKWGLVENVYIAKAYRGRGIGTELMQHTEAQAQLMECEFIKLTSRKEEGKGLYRALGYEESSAFRKDL